MLKSILAFSACHELGAKNMCNKGSQQGSLQQLAKNKGTAPSPLKWNSADSRIWQMSEVLKSIPQISI